MFRGKRSSQSAAEAMDRNGIMYFGVMSDVTFNCWDTSTEYGPANIKIVDANKTTMQFVSGVKVRFFHDIIKIVPFCKFF